MKVVGGLKVGLEKNHQKKGMHLKELKTLLHHMGRGVIGLSKFKRGKRKVNLVERLNLLTIQINLGVFMNWGFRI
jgi:hypothetical protein